MSDKRPNSPIDRGPWCVLGRMFCRIGIAFPRIGAASLSLTARHEAAKWIRQLKVPRECQLGSRLLHQGVRVTDRRWAFPRRDQRSGKVPKVQDAGPRTSAEASGIRRCIHSPLWVPSPRFFSFSHRKRGRISIRSPPGQQPGSLTDEAGVSPRVLVHFQRNG
jgi:hypothetical protein